MCDSGSVMPSLLTARLLGEFRVAVEGRVVGPLEWHHGSAERLLKLVLVTPRHRLRREAAAEILWPGLPSGRGAVNLRRAYHFLGRALDPERSDRLLLREPSMVGLSPFVVLDLDVDELTSGLERLDRSVARQDDAAPSRGEMCAAADAILAFGSGELLPDDCHEDWLSDPRDRLLIRWEAVLLRAAIELERCSETLRAAALLRQVLAVDPANEDAHRTSIRLHVRDGQHHAARRQLEVCRRALRESYGLDPSPTTFAALTVGRRPPIV